MPLLKKTKEQVVFAPLVSYPLGFRQWLRENFQNEPNSLKIHPFE
jgi:hypothetical protein